MTMNRHWTDQLSEYQDGDLTAADHAACEAHLGDCAECRALLEELQLVTATVRAEGDRNPSSDVWQGILTRIESVPQDESPQVWGRPSTRPRQVTLSIGQLALAASLLIAVSAGVAYVAAGRGVSQPRATEPTIQAMAEPMMAISTDATPANFADAQYDQAVSDLEKILADQRDALDPRTVLVIERNLTIIDDAIREARAALDADPANTFLNTHLADARRRKLELLRRATTLGGD